MATAFIWTGKRGWPAANPYFQMCPLEPALPNTTIEIDERVSVDTMDVTKLLDAMIGKGKKLGGGDALVVAHGTSKGLSLPLYGGSKVNLERGAMQALAQNEAKKTSDTETAKILLTSVDTLNNLKTKIKKVRALGLSRLELRCCRVGVAPDVLELTRQFFGAASATAPTMFHVIGALNRENPPTTDAKTWQDWLRKHPRAVVEGQAPARFAWWRPRGSAIITHWLADSEAAIKSWIGAHTPRNSYKEGGLIYYECVVNSARIFSGDKNYRANLKRVP